jgi:hypothetical protein
VSELLTVQAALADVMGDVQSVSKSGRNDSQGFNFRGIDAVVNAVGPALRKHRVIVLPRVLSSTYETFTTRNGALMHGCVLEVEFTFVGPDGSTLSCSTMGESADSGDKASAKAHSVAFRTALLQTLAIPTDEPDPDSHTFERAEPARPVPTAVITIDQLADLKGKLRALPEPTRGDAAALVKQGPKLELLPADRYDEALAFVELCEMATADGAPFEGE